MNLSWLFSRQAHSAAKLARSSRIGKTLQRTQLIHLALIVDISLREMDGISRSEMSTERIDSAARCSPLVKPGNARGRQCKGNRQNFPKL